MKIKNILFLHVRMHSSIENEYWDSYMKAIDSFFLNGQKTDTLKIDFNVSVQTVDKSTITPCFMLK